MVQGRLRLPDLSKNDGEETAFVLLQRRHMWDTPSAVSAAHPSTARESAAQSAGSVSCCRSAATEVPLTPSGDVRRPLIWASEVRVSADTAACCTDLLRGSAGGSEGGKRISRPFAASCRLAACAQHRRQQPCGTLRGPSLPTDFKREQGGQGGQGGLLA